MSKHQNDKPMYEGGCNVIFTKGILWAQTLLWVLRSSSAGSIIITPESLAISRRFPFKKDVTLKKSEITNLKIRLNQGPLSYIQFQHTNETAPAIVVAGYFDDTKDVSAITALRLCGYPEPK